MKITDLPDLLEINSNNKNKKLSKIDFLESLLKNFKDIKEIKDIINHSNLSKEQKEKLIEKFISKLKNKNNLKFDINKNEIPKKLINIEDKKTSKKINNEINNIKLPINNSNKPLSKSPSIKELLKSDKKTSFNDEELNILSNLQTQIKNIPPNKETEIIKKVKTIIIQKSLNNPILKQIVKTDEFKNVSSFKDLIKLSEKFNLNLIKISISQTSQPVHNIQKTDFLGFITINKSIKKPISIKKLLLTQTPKNTPKISLNNLLHPDKSKNKKTKNYLEQLLVKETKKFSKKTTQQKDNNTNTQISTSIFQNDLKPQIITAKQTMQHFTSSLKEAVENYKPPVSKLTLELHPKDLGKVEVTITQRGDNLNIQLNTNNSSTINFFISSQQELKNSLVNMGFGNINMNFNSNQDNQQKQNQNSQKYSKNQNSEDEELIIDFSYKYA